jgi:hypothetical protein
MTGIRLGLVFAFCAGVAIGQNAELSGLIQDPSNSGVSGAEVTIRNQQTGGRRNTSANASGFYSLPALSPGLYRLSIRAIGFETIVREGIKLETGENARLVDRFSHFVTILRRTSVYFQRNGFAVVA